MDVTQRLRIIKESADLVDHSKSLDTRLSRFDLIVEHAQALVKYEDRGISIFTESPSQILKQMQQRRSELILDGLSLELQGAQEKARLSSTPRAKITALSKVLLRVRDFRARDSSIAPLAKLESEIAAAIHGIQLNDYLESARKNEFKGHRKRALEKYYEALYFLRNDEIDDSLQADNIRVIESKIKELGGEIR